MLIRLNVSSMWGSRMMIDPSAPRRIDYGGKDVCLRTRLHRLVRMDRLPYRVLQGRRALVGGVRFARHRVHACAVA